MITNCPYCRPNTGGRHESDCPANYADLQAALATGWKCLRCHKIKSPWVLQCECHEENTSNEYPAQAAYLVVPEPILKEHLARYGY